MPAARARVSGTRLVASRGDRVILSCQTAAPAPAPVVGTTRQSSADHAKAAPAAPGAAQLLKYRLWPLSGAPVVAPGDDVRLGTTGLVPRILDWVDTWAPGLANGIRKGTRIAGPPMYWVSGIANGLMLLHDWHNPAFKPDTKVALATGTGLTLVGAGAATYSALPLQGALIANRVAGVAGGLAGGLFGAINMIVTLRTKTATPTEKVSATGSFILGSLGTIIGTAAVFLPAGTALGPLGLGAWAAVVGGTATALAVTQLLFGKNKWLNHELSTAGKELGAVGHSLGSLTHKALSWV